MTADATGALDRLQELTRDYHEQPAFAQARDLREINELRAALAMPAVDARLRPVVTPPTPRRTPSPIPVDTAAGRALWDVYLAKKAELDAHRTYADATARATAGGGMTPVRPLACGGTGGGPLRCDACGKPIVLEGGRFHGMTADAAWALNPDAGTAWRSWILGGMVVRIAANGTLRIYHGHWYSDTAADGCCEAVRAAEAAVPAVRTRRWDGHAVASLRAFLADEFPDRTDAERDKLLNDVLNTEADYAEGFGVNRPDAPE